MHCPVQRLSWIAAVLCLAALVGFSGAASATPGASAAGKKKPFSLNICALPSPGELAAAQIEAPCHKGKTTTIAPKHSPLGGTVGSVLYEAAWGTQTGPSHSLTVLVTHLLGSGKGLAFSEHIFKLRVLSNGKPLAVGKRNYASDAAETSACVNPPTGDCTRGTFLAIKPGWFVEVFLTGYPPTIPGTTEDEEGSQVNDEAEDIKQEEQLEAPLSTIGKTVTAKA
jgi:hypothetical protein